MKKLMILFLILFGIQLSAQDLSFSEERTKVGGYGELHYNYQKNEGSDASKTLDFHRFVTFLSHSFSEKWSFKAEIELEHNIVEENKGTIELEQAIIDYHYNEAFGMQAGVLLVSAGLINEIHEPPTFFGVERPDYNKLIIPTTWFGNGAAIYGNISGWDYKLSVMEGLNGDKFSPSSGIRSGRQKGFKSNAGSFLYNARINYTDIDGLLVGGSVTFNEAFRKRTTDVSVLMIEGHLKYMSNNLYVNAEIGNISYSSRDIRSSFGFYTDLGYDISQIISIDEKLIPFIRYSELNPVNSFITGGNAESKFNNSKIMLGVNYYPIDEIVLKLDYAAQKNKLSGERITFINAGVGYFF